jgi:Nuclease-related domain
MWLIGVIASWIDHDHAPLWLGLWFVGMVLLSAAACCHARISHRRELRADALVAKLLGDGGPVLAMLTTYKSCVSDREKCRAGVASSRTHPLAAARRELLSVAVDGTPTEIQLARRSPVMSLPTQTGAVGWVRRVAAVVQDHRASSAGRASFSPMVRSSFPRRQQYRRLRRAAASGTTAIAAAALAIIALGTGALALAGALALVTIALSRETRRWLRLAGRSRVGARSENAVRAAVATLQAEGWQLRHSLPYRGHGDIDSVVIAPTGPAFAVETKTRTFHAHHLVNTSEMAVWLCRHRRSWCRGRGLAVLCVVGVRSLERVEDDVLVVSLDRLLPALRVRAGTSPRPKFLAARE